MASKFLFYGDLIRDILLDSPDVAAITTKVFPLMRDKATLPYINYRRASISTRPVIEGSAADTITFELQCCAKDHDQSLRLASAVREALDGIQAEGHGLRIRRSLLIDAAEFFTGDAFVQQLSFSVKM